MNVSSNYYKDKRNKVKVAVELPAILGEEKYQYWRKGQFLLNGGLRMY